MWSSAAEMMTKDILEAVKQENEARRMGIITFIINCLRPVYEWLQALIWGKDEPRTEPFNISEYLQRREKLILSLEDERRAEYTIVLWWGYDGLRLNKDGSREWISRKPPEPISGGAFYQPMQSMAQIRQPIDYSMCQCTQAQIDELWMQNVAQSVNVLAYQPGYLGYCAPIYSSLTSCCCNQTILR